MYGPVSNIQSQSQHRSLTLEQLMYYWTDLLREIAHELRTHICARFLKESGSCLDNKINGSDTLRMLNMRKGIKQFLRQGKNFSWHA